MFLTTNESVIYLFFSLFFLEADGGGGEEKTQPKKRGSEIHFTANPL